ncbi:MAG: ABC transporter ATP-binding protein [Treponema sp.]|nr:ABC transporter ATP-binding protein [Treponema sp.]
MSKIELRDVTLIYDIGTAPHLALDHISLSIEEGEFVCIVGPSGCGKSTLLSLLAGIISHNEGRVLIDGKDIAGPGTNRSVVFQHYSLFPWLTAKKNVIFGLKQVIRDTPSKLEDIALEYLKKVALDAHGDKYPHQLSGGMQQRVAIARSLAMNSDILLMDEPFGSIDTKNRIELQELLRELCVQNGKRKTVVFVTHDVDEALLLGDRILFMQPQKILLDVKVPFEDRGNRQNLIASDEYNRLRKKIFSLFYLKVAEEIGGREVVL